MTVPPDAALAYARMNRERFVNELKDFIRIPSVSTDPDAKPDMRKAADWVAHQLVSIGMQNVKVYPT